jgi:hypothetical protein
MTTTLRARYDGRVLVPEGPVDLPMDRVLELEVADVPEPSAGASSLHRLAQVARDLPPTHRPASDRAAQHDYYLYGIPKRP